MHCFGDGCVSHMDSYQVQKSPALCSGKIPEIHTTFQRPFCTRECGGSIPGWSANHSLNLRELARYGRKSCILRAFRAFPTSLQTPKNGNYSENLPKVSSRNRRNSRLGETFSGDKFRSHCAVERAVFVSPIRTASVSAPLGHRRERRINRFPKGVIAFWEALLHASTF
jgi:hypothetical protein